MWIVVSFVLAGLFFYIYWLNQGIAEFALRPEGPTWQVPLGLLVFISATAGAVFATVASWIGRGRRAVRRWSARKVERKRTVADEFYHRGMERLLAGDFAAAREHFAQATDVFPDHLPARLAEVEAFRKMGDAVGARRRIESLISHDRKNLDYGYKLAQILFENREYLRAAEELRRIISQDGKRAEWWALLAQAYRNGERWEDAVEAAQKAVRLGRGEDPALAALLLEVRHERARIRADGGDRAAAIAALEESFSEKDDCPPAHLLKARLLSDSNRERDAAEFLERCFQKTKDPVFAPPIEELWIKAHDPNRLIRFYRRAIDGDEAAGPLRLLYANALLRIGLIDECQDQLRQMEEQDAENAAAHLLLGEAHYRRQAFEKAGANFRKALGKDNQIQPSYVCTGCHRRNPSGYADRCPACGRFSGLRLTLS
ncbi:MAG: tetratricopeptide repeat protein [Nitrospirae bacterium]|nr:tetratricopeptide repeat protein [Nitrospirota bacterium]